MVNARLATLVLALSFGGVNAFAQQAPATSKSTLKIEDVDPGKNKVDGDLDQEITNAKLRAESGSKSKFSLSFTGSYLGSSLEVPFDKDRPNTSNEATPPRVFMGGSFGGRYRIDKNQSLSLGIGYSVVRPFQEARYWDVSNPYVSYSYAGKIGKVQNISDATLSVTTNRDETEIGSFMAGSLSNTMMYDFGGSRASIGLAAVGEYTYFSKDKDSLARYAGDEADKTFKAGRDQRDYTLAAYPLMEYAISDYVQLRTVFRPWVFNHNVNQEGLTFSRARWTQSIGVGVAVRRDVYLYPNFQYDWEQWRGDDYNWFAKNTRANSTVGLSATLNIF